MYRQLALRAVLALLALILVTGLIVWGVGLDTVKERRVDLIYLGQQHLKLVFSSMALALLVGIPSGILLSRPAARGIAEYVMQIFNVGNTLPPLAVLALAMVVIGIGDTPAIIALFLASLLPIVRNTHTALDSLPPGLREAGRGIGMTFWQRLRWVEIPMALPVIFGGIRTAVVMNIGVMAIAAVIGAGGLGLLLLNGIGGSDIRMLIAGAVMICLLAIVLDWMLHRLQVMLTPKGIR